MSKDALARMAGVGVAAYVLDGRSEAAVTSEEAVVDVAGEIGVEVEPGCTVVRLVGEIDVALREQASQSMIMALTSDNAIVIDASGVTFIDSSGIAFVLQLLHAAREGGLDVTLRDPGRAVSSVLEIVGAASLLPPSALEADGGSAHADDEVVAAPIG